jgi:hypothetical protein
MRGHGNSSGENKDTAGVDMPESLRVLVGDDINDPLLASTFDGPSTIDIQEFKDSLPAVGGAMDAQQINELRTCLELVYDSIDGYAVGEFADQFEAAITLCEAEPWDCKPGAAEMIRQCLHLGYTYLDDTQHARLEAAIAPLR